MGQADILSRAKLEAEESLRLKLSEKDQQLLAMTKQIEDLKRRAEQGSQQAQGEILELELEALLKNKSSPWAKVSLAVTSCSVSTQRLGSLPASSSGNSSEPKTGAMAGWPSCERTSAP
jgi:Uncharacterized protein conserved in bacteria (DUF2130)